MANVYVFWWAREAVGVQSNDGEADRRGADLECPARSSYREIYWHSCHVEPPNQTYSGRFGAVCYFQGFVPDASCASASVSHNLPLLLGCTRPTLECPQPLHPAHCYPTTLQYFQHQSSLTYSGQGGPHQASGGLIRPRCRVTEQVGTPYRPSAFFSGDVSPILIV